MSTITAKDVPALIGKNIHVRYWVGQPRFLTEDRGRVLGFYGENRTAIEMTGPRTFGSPSTCVVSLSAIEELTIQ